MTKVRSAVAGAIIGGVSSAVILVLWFGWKSTVEGQPAHVDPTRADFIDLLLTLVTILLAAVGLAVTVGALVIGLVALKTLREIKDDAASRAKDAAATKISETMATDLEPKVDAKVREILPLALQIHLVEEETRNNLTKELARSGALDEAVARVMERMNYGGPLRDPRDVEENGDQV